MCINNFRVSDSDFATYLTILGYKIKNIEVNPLPFNRFTQNLHSRPCRG